MLMRVNNDVTLGLTTSEVGRIQFPPFKMEGIGGGGGAAKKSCPVFKLPNRDFPIL